MLSMLDFGQRGARGRGRRVIGRLKECYDAFGRLLESGENVFAGNGWQPFLEVFRARIAIPETDNDPFRWKIHAQPAAHGPGILQTLHAHRRDTRHREDAGGLGKGAWQPGNQNDARGDAAFAEKQHQHPRGDFVGLDASRNAERQAVDIKGLPAPGFPAVGVVRFRLGDPFGVHAGEVLD